MDKMRNNDLSKRCGLWLWKNIYYKNLNNKTETMTEQWRYHKRNREKCLEKGRKYYVENKKEGYKK